MTDWQLSGAFRDTLVVDRPSDSLVAVGWRRDQRARTTGAGKAMRLGPWGEGTVVEWSDHANVMWVVDGDEFGVSKEVFEHRVVTQNNGLRDRADRREPRINRFIKVRNNRTVCVVFETIEEMEPGRPGSIEIVTAFVTENRP